MKTKNIFIILFILLAAGGYVYLKKSFKASPGQANSSETVMSSQPSEQGGAKLVTSEDIRCYGSGQFNVLFRDKVNEVGSDILVKRKDAASTLGSCEFKLESGDYEILEDDAYYKSLSGDLLILDSGTSPAPRGLIVYDLNKKAKVFSDWYFKPLDITSSEITYWRDINIKPTKENCPEFTEIYEKYGGGAIVLGEVKLALVNLRTTDTGKRRCSYLQ